MKRQSDGTDLNRRAVLMAGLAGASALVFGGNSNLFAAEDKGVERKTGKDVESMIPGFPKVRFREITLQPGASTKATMKNLRQPCAYLTCYRRSPVKECSGKSRGRPDAADWRRSFNPFARNTRQLSLEDTF